MQKIVEPIVDYVQLLVFGGEMLKYLRRRKELQLNRLHNRLFTQFLQFAIRPDQQQQQRLAICYEAASHCRSDREEAAAVGLLLIVCADLRQWLSENEFIKQYYYGSENDSSRFSIPRNGYNFRHILLSALKTYHYNRFQTSAAIVPFNEECM